MNARVPATFDPAYWRGRRVTIFGLGSFGGGVGATRFFADLGAHVTVTDKASATDLREPLAAIEGLDVRLVLGGHDDRDFIETDLVVVSPAVPASAPQLATAHAHNVPLTTEMNVFFQLCPAPMVGVTGSNGKSTTTALTAHLLAGTNRKTWLGGNIGKSLLPEWRNITPTDFVVLELSSFQLEDLRPLGRSPHVAVITNISPNHLDRHLTFEAYVAAKQEILRHQAPEDFAVLNYDDPPTREFAPLTSGQALFFSRKQSVTRGAFRDGDLARFVNGTCSFTVPLTGTRLIGNHNVENMLAAVSVAGILSVTPETIVRQLVSFQPLEHRLQLVGTVDGVRYYNDSIATTPDSVICALDSFDCPIVLIAGGYDKHISFESLARVVVAKRPRLRKLILLGQTASVIEAEVARQDAPLDLVERVANLTEAVSAAHRIARPGDAVLLSPACASYDQFRNFRQRGEQFAQMVKALTDRTDSPGAVAF